MSARRAKSARHAGRTARRRGALGRERIVEGRGDQHFDDRLRRPAGQPRIEISALHVGEVWGDHDSAPMMLGGSASGESGKARQFGEREVHAERARAAAVRGDAGAEVGGQSGRVEKLFEGELRVQVGDDRARRDPFAIRGDDADGAALADQDLARPPQFVRISTPRSMQARAIACVIAPMPPIAWPQAPFLPFTSPKQWCRST